MSTPPPPAPPPRGFPCREKVTMVWMEPAGSTSSVAPVFNDLDLQVVAYDGSTETVFYPNNLAAKDPDNTVEMIRIPDVDLYEWFNVRTVSLPTINSLLFMHVHRFPRMWT